MQPGDVGLGYRVVAGGEHSGDWTFEFSMSMLECRLGIGRMARGEAGSHAEPGNAGGRRRVARYVPAIGPGRAARNLDQVRARVEVRRPATGKWVRIDASRFADRTHS